MYHPTAKILATISLLFSLQFLSSLWLLGLATVMLLAQPPATQLQRWYRLIQRNRLLILVLCLITAYAAPGENLLGLWGVPAKQGFFEVFLQLGRFLVMLLILARLLASTSHPELLLGLWSMLRPWRIFGLPVEQTVVRLSLVLDTLTGETLHHKIPSSLQAWKTELMNVLSAPSAKPESTHSPDKIQLHPKLWLPRDSTLVLVSCIPFFIALWE